MSLAREIILKTAWWAPAAVLVLHKVVMRLGLRGQTDWLLHLSGGLAITLFIWTLIPVMGRFLGTMSTNWRFLVAFLAGCTIALFWDLAEFASDQILGTDVQHSLEETMLDLAYGAAGVTIMIVILMVSVSVRGKTRRAEQGAADQLPARGESEAS